MSRHHLSATASFSPTRRQSLQWMGAGTMSALLTALCPNLAQAELVSDEGRRLYNDVLTYFANNPHRTGSPGDIATARWLASELAKAGVASELQPFRFTQFDLHERSLSVAGEDIDMFPLWLPHPTPASGIKAQIAEMSDATQSLKGKIALFEADKPVVNKSSNHAAMIERAHKAGALAVICSNGGYQSEDSESEIERTHRLTENSFAPFNQIQWPLPSASVAYKDYATLQAASRSNTPAHMRITGEMKPDTEAFNVIGRIERGTQPIVVSTPLSGWIDSAGERGGGVALWLDLARWASAPGRKASYLFNATSGHEIGHMGQNHFLKTLGPKPAATLAWLHLGSGLGTYDWEESKDGYLRRHDSEGVQNVGASPDLLPLVKRSFGYLPPRKLIPAGQAMGELRGAYDAGYATFGLYGGNMFSHAGFDGPEQVSPILLARLSRGLKTALSELDKKA